MKNDIAKVTEQQRWRTQDHVWAGKKRAEVFRGCGRTKQEFWESMWEQGKPGFLADWWEKWSPIPRVPAYPEPTTHVWRVPGTLWGGNPGSTWRWGKTSDPLHKHKLGSSLPHGRYVMSPQKRPLLHLEVSRALWSHCSDFKRIVCFCCVSCSRARDTVQSLTRAKQGLCYWTVSQAFKHFLLTLYHDNVSNLENPSNDSIFDSTWISINRYTDS